MKSELFELKNVGQASYGDLCLLGVTSIKQMAQLDAKKILTPHITKG